jgi:hypothetical protein
MSAHKFQVGQTLQFRPGRLGRKECTIVRLLPVENGANLYRIKCMSENFERVAKEAELVTS